MPTQRNPAWRFDEPLLFAVPFFRRGFFLVAITFFSILASGSYPARAAAPPDSFLLASGETVMRGALPDDLALRNGTIRRSEIEPSFALLPLEGDSLYLWSSADDSVAELSEHSFSLPHLIVAVYRPSEGLLERGLVLDGQGSAFENAQVELIGGTLSLGEVLSESGSFAIFSPELLSPTQYVPEPSFSFSIAALMLTGACLNVRSGVRRGGRAIGG